MFPIKFIYVVLSILVYDKLKNLLHLFINNVCIWQLCLERVETGVDGVGVDLGLLSCRLIAGAFLQVDDAKLYLRKH